MTELEALETVGLTRTEAKIYLFLLRHGSSSQTEITEGVQLHRRTVYDVIGRLVKKGIASAIMKNNRKQYEACKPERIKEMLTEKNEALENILPALNSMLSSQTKKEEIKFFKGKHGLKTVFEDQINEGKPLMILGASSCAYKMMKYYFRSFDRRRIERKIKARIILENSAKSKFSRAPLSEIRYIPEEIGSVAATNIYGNKVAIILWNEYEPFAILIDSSAIAESYRKLFETIWNKAKK